ncbi:hypothetical protein ACOTV1_02360 [Aliarcobacter butzleri]|uniref:Uncharacterized protein n=1 Tax=Aliarcobacter butzleri TaxID=28197 RepID=A0AAW6VN98_9BACT|nr:hypothetical protein [Aliarcobacter butzleri]MCG3701998.1 hypothetical protein [Aliarcobacter butzleri]MDK2061644.1 hypothetical protein [Aliarcobacter butzleri]
MSLKQNKKGEIVEDDLKSIVKNLSTTNEEILKMLISINEQLKNIQIVIINNRDGNVAVNSTMVIGNENIIDSINL